jgi:hypothetical protein
MPEGRAVIAVDSPIDGIYRPSAVFLTDSMCGAKAVACTARENARQNAINTHRDFFKENIITASFH